MNSRIEIETVKDFRIRHQDILFLIAMILVSIPVHGIFISIASKGSANVSFGITIGLVVLDILLISGVIVNGWYHLRERRNEIAYIEDGRIIKKQNNYLIFDFPLESIVSVRVLNKKGLEGTVILFTEKESLKYFVTYGLKQGSKLSVHGFTDYKISFVKDRKQLLTEIYTANPKLHFIESF